MHNQETAAKKRPQWKLTDLASEFSAVSMVIEPFPFDFLTLLFFQIYYWTEPLSGYSSISMVLVLQLDWELLFIDLHHDLEQDSHHFYHFKCLFSHVLLHTQVIWQGNDQVYHFISGKVGSSGPYRTLYRHLLLFEVVRVLRGTGGLKERKTNLTGTVSRSPETILET